MVSTQRKYSEQKKTCPLAKNPFPQVGMKDFVEIQYSVLWKLGFDQRYFWLVETIFGIRGKQFSKKELILASGQLIFRPVEIICFLHFSETPVIFFPSSGKVFFKEILIFG